MCLWALFIHSKGYWAGVVKGKLVTHLCPRDYCRCNQNGTDDSSECFYDYNKPNEICAKGRGNTLCGRCNDGLSVGLQSSTCRDCSGSWFIVFSILVVLACTFGIIFFNPGIPSDLRGILFCVQVLPYVFPPNNRIGNIVNLVTAFADLGRPSDYPFDTCVLPGLGNLHIVALSYLTPLIIIIILFICYLRRNKINLKRDSPFQSFFVLLIVMYKYLTETSLQILHCVHVGGKYLCLRKCFCF